MGNRVGGTIGVVKAYLASKAAGLLVVLLGVTTLAFVLGRMAPGDPAEIVLERALGRPPTDSQIDSMRHQMGLDRPVATQYAAWIAGIAHGELGQSWGSGDRVGTLLIERLPRTLLLATTALLLSACVALPMGVWGAARTGSSVDHVTRFTAVLSTSLPTFFIGYVLMFLFGVRLHLLPIFGFGSPRHLVLPALTLAFGTTGMLARVTRASVSGALQEPYVLAAMARGVPRPVVLFRHALKAALVPILAVGALAAGHLLSGAMIVEWMFSWPGLGTLGLDAIYNRDYPLIQGLVLVSGVTFTVVTFAADLAYAWADPRVRLKARID